MSAKGNILFAVGFFAVAIYALFTAVTAPTPEDAIYTAAMVALAGIVFYYSKGVGWEEKLFMAMILTLSFYRIGRIHLPLFRIFPAQLFIILLVGHQIIKRMYLPRALEGMRQHPLLLPMVGFLVVCLVSIYKSAWIPSNASLYPLLGSSARNTPYIKSITQIFWIAIGFAAFFLTTILVRSRADVIKTTKFWVYGQTLTAALSFVQIFGHVSGIGAIQKFFRGGADVHGLEDTLGISVFRVTSVFTEPSHLSVFHGIIIPLAVVFAVRKFEILTKKERITFVGLVLASFVLTFSRTTIMVIGFLGLLGLMQLARQSLLQGTGRRVSVGKVVLALGVAGIAIEIFARFAYGGSIIDIITFQFGTIEDKDNVSNFSRLTSAITAWRMFVEHPVLGVGIGNYVFHIVEYAPIKTFIDLDYLMPIVGNIYLEILAETGIVGFVMFAWILLAIRGYVKRAIRFTGDQELKSIMTAQMMGYYTMLFGFLTFSAFFFPFVWAFVGWMIVTARAAFMQPRQSRRHPLERFGRHETPGSTGLSRR